MAEGGKRRLLHELRTPLTQIIGYAEMLAEEAQEAAQQRQVEILRRISQAGRTLTALLEDAFGVSKGPVEGDAPAATPLDEEEPSGTPQQGRILVVDDNELNRDMLSRRLRLRGYTVVTAEGGPQALAAVEAAPFDLVLLDVMMPEMSGLDVLRALRATRSRAELPVIMATARDHSDDVVEALRLGANDYVTKPLDFPVVLARSEVQIQAKRASEEVRRLAQGLERRNRLIRETFGRYLSDEVVDGLLESGEAPRLGGERRTVTILMSDIRGFASATEGLPPEAVVKMLNGYLEAMVDVVLRHRGTVDEILGDAMLVLFGAPVLRPDDAERAVACALEMQLEMGKVNERFRREWLPQLEMGIALDTGPVVVGSIGSEKRAKYGVVGSHVNLTSRLESFTVGGQVLITESTRLAAGEHVRVGPATPIQAKGFREPVTVYELLGLAGSYALALPDRKAALRALPEPIAVRYMIVDEKSVGGPLHDGALVALAENAATLRAQRPLRLFTELQLRFVGPQGEVPAEVYGKVAESDGHETLVRFTSVPLAARRFLRERMAGS